MKNKFLFIHVPRTSGCFINNYMKKHIFYDFIIFDSWHQGKNRDWTDEELLNFLKFKKCYVHNHTWENDIFFEFYNKQWFSFFFIRNPKDILCSRYFYDKEKGSNCNVGLEEFINSKDGFERNLFPSFWRKVSYIDEFSEESFCYFLQKIFNKKYVVSPKINNSNNLGYEYYFNNGDISKETNEKIESSLFFKEYLMIKKFIKCKKIKLQ
jgi:hypothetical protein